MMMMDAIVLYSHLQYWYLPDTSIAMENLLVVCFFSGFSGVRLYVSTNLTTANAQTSNNRQHVIESIE